jgi:hypothetical protein
MSVSEINNRDYSQSYSTDSLRRRPYGYGCSFAWPFPSHLTESMQKIVERTYPLGGKKRRDTLRKMFIDDELNRNEGK